MPLKTQRKDTSKHLYQVKVSGCTARLASCSFILTMWTRVTDLLVLTAATAAWKTKVSNYHLKLTNKNILLHLPATKINFTAQKCFHSILWLAVCNLFGFDRENHLKWISQYQFSGTFQWEDCEQHYQLDLAFSKWKSLVTSGNWIGCS